MLNERSSGILLHITSLPGRFGIGDLGPESYNFINFLAETGQKAWEILPIGPTGFGNSPYSCQSAFAGNFTFISFEKLRDISLITDNELENTSQHDPNHVTFGSIFVEKGELLRIAFRRFKDSTDENLKNDFSAFCEANNWWLHNYAMFTVIKEDYAKNGHNGDWTEWDQAIVLHTDEGMIEWEKKLGNEVYYEKFLQFIFYKQWYELKAYANEKGIKIIGDVPIYVAFDGADVWANQDIFELGENKKPLFTTGISGDFQGQDWGHPHFNWNNLREKGFSWNVKRLGRNLELYDMVRIDHFVGYEWQFYIPAGSKKANDGEWREAPGEELLQAYTQAYGENIPLIVEDFGGKFTGKLFELRDTYGLAGMKILEAAFNGDEGNGNLPQNIDKENYVSYTGNHDNDTVKGWFQSIPEEAKAQVLALTQTDVSNISWDIIKMNLFTRANLAVCQMQDILDLDATCRMNNPGTIDGNWGWRFRWDQVTDDIKISLKSLTEESGRSFNHAEQVEIPAESQINNELKSNEKIEEPVVNNGLESNDESEIIDQVEVNNG